MKNSIKCIVTAILIAGAMSMTSFAAGWQQNETGWWYGTNADNTSWYSNTWQWLDGNGDEIEECYYFDANGYALLNTNTPDGYTVDANGAWVQNGFVQCRSVINPKHAESEESAEEEHWEEQTKEEADAKDNSKAMTASGKSGTSANSTKSSKTNSGYENTLYSGSSGSSSSSSNSDNMIDPDDLSDYAQECFERINKERVKKGLDELEWDDTIAEACQIRAEEITEKFSHVRPDGSICFTAFDEVGFFSSAEGENIAEGQSTPKSVVKAWMNSKGHRENILKSGYNRSAIGFVYDPDAEYHYYWVQMFGRE